MVIVTVSDFRGALPEFNDVNAYPDAYIQRFITHAEMFISTQSGRLRDDVRKLAIEYMTAHLITLSATDGTGATKDDSSSAGMTLASSSIDSVSVSFQGLIAKDSFEQWIQSTPYGRLYWALLSANNPVGIHYVGTPRAFGVR